MKEFSMSDLHLNYKKLGPQELILDVRRQDEFMEGHVPGSRNIPHEEVGRYAQELAKYQKIYIHCRSGKRAQVAREILEKCGLKNLVCISNGGMLDWESAGYEIEK